MSFLDFLIGLPQTVEECDKHIARLEKEIISARDANTKKSLKRQLVDVKARKKELKAKK